MRVRAVLVCSFVFAAGCLPPGIIPTADSTGSGDNGVQGGDGAGSDGSGATPQSLQCGCRTAADCGNASGDLAGSFCLSDGTQSFCAPSCADAPCGDGSTCIAIPVQGAVLKQCVPSVVSCGPAASGSGSTSSAGTSSGDAMLDAHRQHCLDQLNMYRAQNGVAPLALDGRINDFAQEGSVELSMDHMPHQHFIDAANSGTYVAQAENQGAPNGWTVAPEDEQIDEILAAMMAEGPGGGHHDNIVSPSFRRVGVGLVEDTGGHLFFTNDFAP